MPASLTHTPLQRGGHALSLHRCLHCPHRQHSDARAGRGRCGVPAAVPDLRGRLWGRAGQRGARRLHVLRAGGPDPAGQGPRVQPARPPGAHTLAHTRRHTYLACVVGSLLTRSLRRRVIPSQRWVCARQMPFSGGFQGRANKLVDGCYSFWQGGCTVLLAELAKGKVGALAHWISEEDAAAGAAAPAGPVCLPPFSSSSPRWLALTSWHRAEDVAVREPSVARVPHGRGGPSALRAAVRPAHTRRAARQTRNVRGRAGMGWAGRCASPRCPLPSRARGRDRYHTCYCLSGLSCAQHFGNAVLGQEDRNRVVRAAAPSAPHETLSAPPDARRGGLSRLRWTLSPTCACCRCGTRSRTLRRCPAPTRRS